MVYYVWYEEWVHVDIEIGPASGGTNVTVFGHGFDWVEVDDFYIDGTPSTRGNVVDRPAMDYVCRFTDPNNATVFMDSAPAEVFDSQTLTCVTPPWGSLFSWLDSGVRLTLQHALPGPGGFRAYGLRDREVPQYGPTSLDGPDAARPVLFDFYPVWSTFSTNNIHGSKGGDEITLVASGLRGLQHPDGLLLYVCTFTTD
jgi:hypothetical protein